jgi:hypothetical protein
MLDHVGCTRCVQATYKLRISTSVRPDAGFAAGAAAAAAVDMGIAAETERTSILAGAAAASGARAKRPLRIVE